MANIDKTRAQELKEKITEQKEKIETLQTYYDGKISKLDSKKQLLEMKASGLKIIPGTSKKSDQKLEEMKAVSEEISEMKSKKREEIADAKNKLEELKSEYDEVKNKLKAARSESMKLENIQSQMKKKMKNPTRTGIIVGLIGLFFAFVSLSGIGDGNASGVSIFTLIIGAMAAIFSVPAFIVELKERKQFVKSIIGISLTGATILGSLIAIIADPISVNIQCSSYNSVEEMKIGDSSKCKKRVAELEQQKQDEENAKKEAAQKAKDECAAKNHDWNSTNNRCNTEEEQAKLDAEKKAKSDCSAKNHDWNSSENRCYTDSEQQAKNAEREAEKKRQEEANKTTNVTGVDHDANDTAGKFTKITNACLDRVEVHYPGAYPLDSYDGAPIYYSVTLKGDGTLVEGSMTGKIKTKYGNKILDYDCTYKNGSAKIRGFD